MRKIVICTIFLLCAIVTYSQKSVAIVSTYCPEYTPNLDRIVCHSNCDSIFFIIGNLSNNKITYQKKNSLSEVLDTFRKDKKELLVYIHGNGYHINTISETEDSLSAFNDALALYFVWPSKQRSGSVVNYLASKASVGYNLHKFVTMTHHVQDYAQQNNMKVTFLFHSLGNLFAKEYAEYLIDNDSSSLFIDNIIINASCIRENDHVLWINTLAKHVKGKVYITHNENDKILKLARVFIEQEELLGENVPIKRSKQSVYIDFTPLLTNKGADDSHAYYTDKCNVSEIKNFYSDVIKNKPIKIERALLMGQK